MAVDDHGLEVLKKSGEQVTAGDPSNLYIKTSVINSLAPTGFDYIALTYVAEGDGVGEIETVVYKSGGSGGTTLRTLTLGYDASDRLDEITVT